MNEFDEMEIFEEDDVFDCIDFNDNGSTNHTLNNNIMEIINGEIQLIDYALNKSALYDLQQIDVACDNEENKENKDENKVNKESSTKYKKYHDLYQFVVELEISSGDIVIIGALIPKGYVVLPLNDKSNDNDDNDLIWYDSIHNLLLKTCKQYQKLATERIQRQLETISTVKSD